MAKTTSKFDVTKISPRQKQEIAQTGAFRTSRGEYKDSTGKKVAQPTTTLTTVPKPEPVPITNPDGTVDAEKLQNGMNVSLPEPTTPNNQELFQTGLASSVATAKTELDTLRTTEKDAALKRETDLNDKLLKLKQDSDPTKRDTYAQEERILQNQLNVAENASMIINEDFNKRRAVVSELDKLLTQSNQILTMAKNRPVAVSVLDRSVENTMQTIQARAGVLESVVTALDGNITRAHSIIDNAQTAVASKWNDVKEYNESYLKLVESGELAKNKIHDDYAKAQVDEAQSKLDELEETSKYIKDLMIDPKTAQFMADAGITLNDSVEDIKTKLSEQSKRDEISATINDLTMEGYEYVPFGEGRDDVVSLDIGGKTLYFVPPVKELQDTITSALKSGATQSEVAQLNDPNLTDREKLVIAQSVVARGENEMRSLDMEAKRASTSASWQSASTSRTNQLLALAEVGNPDAIKELGLTLPDNTEPSSDEIAYAQEYSSTGKVPSGLKGLGISFGRIAELAKDLPKPPGVVVNTTTGVTPNNVSSTQLEGYGVVKDIIEKSERLAELNEERAKGISGGVASLFGSDIQKQYNDLRQEIVDLLSRARTGAALTKDEELFYQEQLPGTMTETAFGIFSPNSTDRIRNNFKLKLEDTLNTKLQTQGLTMYGFSTVEKNGETYTVGEVITNSQGQSGIVNADGSITLIK